MVEVACQCEEGFGLPHSHCVKQVMRSRISGREIETGGGAIPGKEWEEVSRESYMRLWVNWKDVARELLTFNYQIVTEYLMSGKSPDPVAALHRIEILCGHCDCWIAQDPLHPGFTAPHPCPRPDGLPHVHVARVPSPPVPWLEGGPLPSDGFSMEIKVHETFWTWAKRVFGGSGPGNNIRSGM